jgi:hypothetical protein
MELGIVAIVIELGIYESGFDVWFLDFFNRNDGYGKLGSILLLPLPKLLYTEDTDSFCGIDIFIGGVLN